MEAAPPTLIDVQTHLAARAGDLQALVEELRKAKTGVRAFQRLHFANRRRVQSHNPYRIPRRLRGPMLREFEEKPVNPSRRPRRDRRRPANLFTHFGSRQSNGIWLETHLWMAKRMHMEERWGFKLPMRPTQKCARRQFRFSLRRCVIHDASYMSVRQLPLSLLAAVVDTDAKQPPASGVKNTTLRGGLEPCEIIVDCATESFVLITHPLLEFTVKELLLSAAGACTPAPPRDMVLFELFGLESLSTLRSALLAAEVEVMHVDKEEVKRLRRILNEQINSSRMLYEVNDKKSFVLRAVAVPQILGPFNPPAQRLQHSPGVSTVEETAEYILDQARLRTSVSMTLPTSGGSVAGDKALAFKITLRSRKRKDTKRVAAQLRDASGTKGEAADASERIMPKTKLLVWLNCLSDSLTSVRVLLPRNSIGRSLWTLLNRYGAMPLGVECRRHILATHSVMSFPDHYIYSRHCTERWAQHRAERIAKWMRTPKSKRVNFADTDPRNPHPFGLGWIAEQPSELRWIKQAGTDPLHTAENVLDRIAAHHPIPGLRPSFVHWVGKGRPRLFDLLFSDSSDPDAPPVGQLIEAFHSLLTGRGFGLCYTPLAAGSKAVDRSGSTVFLQ